MGEESVHVALIVHSCDRYKLLHKGFYWFFSEHWDHSIPCRCYISTEEEETAIPGFENVRTGKGEWADRFRFLLTEKVREDYVLFFQEDMWLTKKVNGKFFKDLFEMAAERNWNMVKLHSSDVYKTVATTNYIEGFNVTKVDIANSKFLFSHQVTFWKKEFLLAQLLKNERPWQNERLASERMKTLRPEIFHIDYFAENGNAEINKNIDPKGRSEYQGVSVNGTLHHNVRPFIAHLMKGDKEQKEYARKLRYHYLRESTHDGKRRPQKEKAWMNFKIWMKGLKPRLAYLIFGKLN